MDKKDYKAGDIACLTNCEQFPEYDDTECYIIRGWGLTRFHDPDTMKMVEGFRYIVLTHDGRRIAPRRDQLKPRVSPPPIIIKEKVEA